MKLLCASIMTLALFLALPNSSPAENEEGATVDERAAIEEASRDHIDG